MLSFIFAGKDSFLDFGIQITRRPSIPSPKRKVTYLSVDGRDSSFRLDSQTYEDLTITIECTVRNDQNVAETIDRMKDWLLNAGEADLVFSFQPDKKYLAQVVNSIDFKQVYKRLGQFVIVFNCRPFKYAVANDKIVITEQPFVLKNIGNIKAEPVITVFGTGNVELTISGLTVKLYNLTDYLVLDTVLLECYRASELRNKDMVGMFPELNPGENLISWTGNVTRVELIPNTRWL